MTTSKSEQKPLSPEVLQENALMAGYLLNLLGAYGTLNDEGDALECDATNNPSANKGKLYIATATDETTGQPSGPIEFHLKLAEDGLDNAARSYWPCDHVNGRFINYRCA